MIIGFLPCCWNAYHIRQWGYRTLEMNGGSAAPYLVCTPCVPLFCALFNRGGNRRALEVRAGDHFRCTVEPLPGHIRCQALKSVLRNLGCCQECLFRALAREFLSSKDRPCPTSLWGGLSHSVVAVPSAPFKSINQRSEKLILTDITEKRRRDRPRQLDREVDRRKESRTVSVVRKVEAKTKMCQNGHALWRFRNQKTLRKEKSANETFGHTKIRKTSQNWFSSKILIFAAVLGKCEDKFNFRAGKGELNWYRSNESRQSFNYRSTIVQLSFTGQMRAGNRSTKRSNESSGYRSTIVQLSFNYRSTIVQLSFNNRSMIVQRTERNQMRAGNRATFLQIIVQAHAWHFPDFGAHFGNFVQFCHFLCFCGFFLHERGRTTRNSENEPGRNETLWKNRFQAIFWLKNFVRPSSVGSPQTLVTCTAKNVRFYPS